jgi:hypothetical protein
MMLRMEWFTLPSQSLDAFGCRGVRADQATVRADGGFTTHVAHFEPGGIIGRHPTRLWRLFAVISGSGWVSGHGAGSWPIKAGEAVLWEPGEVSQSTATEPMIVLVIHSRSRPSLVVDIEGDAGEGRRAAGPDAVGGSVEDTQFRRRRAGVRGILERQDR